jgi:hypothetical protein
MNHADGEVGLANVDVDDLAIDAGTLVHQRNVFGGDIGGALGILRQGRHRDEQPTQHYERFHRVLLTFLPTMLRCDQVTFSTLRTLTWS